MARRTDLPALRILLLAIAGLAFLAPAAHGSASVDQGHAVKGSRVILQTKAPINGQPVSGQIRWRVTVQGSRPRSIRFVVDGSLRRRLSARMRTRRRAVTMLDTTRLSNGRHVLTTIAYPASGRRRAKSRVEVTVNNQADAPTQDRPLIPANGPGSLYWGAWIGSHLTGGQAPWDWNAVTRFEQMAGRNMSLMHFAAPFANCASSPCSFYGFPLTPMNNIRQHGAIPFFSWSSQSIPWSENEPDYQLSDVIAGRYDSYIRSFATAAKNWGHPFFLRFNWEMNGNWFPWHEGINGNRPGESAAAWRHVHDIFAEVGAGNASWVWCPNVDPDGTLTDLASLYPGDAYVDWTCLDGYNWGTNPAGNRQGWRSFDRIFGSTYDEIVSRIAPSKPMIVGETASTEYGGSKAAWIENMLATVPTYSKIRGLLWFERYDDGMDWPLITSGEAEAAFNRGMDNAAYTDNSYAGLSTDPIQPPS